MAACGEKKASEPCVHQEHLDVLLKDNERHRLENIKLKSLCESLQARLDGAEAQLIAERQWSNSLLELERKRARRLERTISALREKLERLSFRLLLRKPKAKRAIQCDIELPDARTEEIEAHLLSFDAQLRAFKEKVSAHEVESRAKEEQLAAQGADLRAKGEQLAAHDGLELPEADIEARLSAFDNELQAAKEKISTQDADLQATKEQLAAREVELRAKDEQLATLGADLRATKEQFATRGADLRAKEEQFAAQGAELRATKADLRVKEEQLAAQGDELRATKEQLATKDAAHKAELSAKDAAHKAELSALRAELQATQGKYMTTQQRLAELRATCKDLQDQLDLTENDLRRTERELLALQVALAIREKMRQFEMLVVVDIGARQFHLSREKLLQRGIYTLTDLCNKKGYRGHGLLRYFSPQQLQIFQQLKERGNTVAHSLHGISQDQIRRVMTECPGDSAQERHDKKVIYGWLVYLHRVYGIPFDESPLPRPRPWIPNF